MANVFTSLSEDKKLKGMIDNCPVFLNVSKKILARQSIFRNIDCNIKREIKQIPSFLTEEQIKTSSIYEKLFQRIQKTKIKQEEDIKQHQKTMQRMADQISFLKASVQEDKMKMWEVKNQIMELQEILDQEMEEYNALCQQMRAQQEQKEFDGQESDLNDQNYDQNNQIQNFQSQGSSGCYELRINNSEQPQKVSHPSCSIKYLISNRTITPPDFSKQNFQVGLGMNVNSQQQKSQNQEKKFNSDNQNLLCTQHNLLSFKKSEKFLLNQIDIIK